MSKIALTPNASGTGTFTIASPNSNTDRTLTLPDAAGTVLIADGSGNVAVTGDLTIADKIVHSGDTNTAVRFPAADTVAVETAGSERMRIDSNGNVLCGSDGGGDIGSSTKRFRNLYLVGGAYLGGTTSANLLDDYEEGTWTPTGFTDWSVNPTFSSTPTYTKIGRTVTLFLYFGSGTTGTQARFGGVPFSGEGTGAGVNGSITNMGLCLVSGTTCWFTLNSTSLTGARFSITYVV